MAAVLVAGDADAGLPRPSAAVSSRGDAAVRVLALPVIRAVFGAKGQLCVGVLAFVLSCLAWWYGTELSGEALIRFLFHVSMGALVLASYAIIATSLGYRATERVEAHVAQVENADEVNVG